MQMEQLPYREVEPKREALDSKPRGLSFRQAIRAKQFWIVWLGVSCFAFGVFTIVVYNVAHGVDLAPSTASAAGLLALMGGMSIAGRILLGSLADKIGKRQALAICFVTVIVVFSGRP